MSAPQTPELTLAEAPLNVEMAEATKALLEAGYAVYVYGKPRIRAAGFVTETWVIIERNGNVGTVSHDRFDGYRVRFMIEPSAATGSALLVGVPREGRDDRDPRGIEDVLVCAELATGLTYKNFATREPLPNHGWVHFSWAQKSLIQVVA